MKKQLTRALSFVTLLILLCSATACSVQLRPFGPQESSAVCEHEFVTTGNTATCTEAGEIISSCPKCGEVIRETVPALGHDSVTVAAREATCTVPGVKEAYEGCSRCDLGLTEENAIPALGHDYEWHDAQEPTCTDPGYDAYRTCTRCDYTDYQELPPTGHVFVEGECKCGALEYTIYASKQAYNALGEEENGKALQALYHAIDTDQTQYLTADKDAEERDNGSGGTYYAVGIYEGDGLTLDELRAVWSAYRADHPLYFWIGSLSYTVSGPTPSLILTTDPAYATGAARAAKLKQVLSGLSVLLTGVPTADDYEIALYLHDRIISGADYAYEADGVTPEDTLDAHSVAGYFAGDGVTGRVVCEGYAKLYHACLNARGVENMYVTGLAGGGHAWNLVRIGTAGWYWCDLTWDDTPDLTCGRRYDFFLKNDTEIIGGKSDGGVFYESKTFAGTHQPSDNTLCSDYQYPLPTRAATPLGESTMREQLFLIRDAATLNGVTYARIGAEEVQLTALLPEKDTAGAFTVPKTVRFDGDPNVYTIVAIGAQNTEGFFGNGAIADNITSVTISSTVRTVWYGALAIPTLESITVHGENKCFIADKTTEGILYTHDKTVLVQYPLGHATLTPFTIPPEVTAVASGAFGYSDTDGVVRAQHLKTLTIGAGVERFGVRERGFGYTYGAEEWEDIDQELGRLFRISGGELTFRVASEAVAFTMADETFEITSADGKTLYLARNRMDSSVKEYTIGASVTVIGDYAFDAYPALTGLSYAGTVEAFETLASNSSVYWASGLAARGITTVTCSDGVYTIGAGA